MGGVGIFWVFCWNLLVVCCVFGGIVTFVVLRARYFGVFWLFGVLFAFCFEVVNFVACVFGVGIRPKFGGFGVVVRVVEVGWLLWV